MSEGLNSTPAPLAVTHGDERSPEQLRIDELNARRHEVAHRRAERAAEIERQEEIAAAERALADEEALEKFETEIGPVGRMIAAIETPLGAVIVKRPHAATFKRFQDRESKKTKDVEDFVFPCRVHPDRAAFDRILEQLPGTLTRCANACARLAGSRVEEASEK